MPNEKPTQFPALTGANLSLLDVFTLVDKSDTTDSVDGSDKNMVASELKLAMQRLFCLPQPALGTELETNSSNTTWVDVTGVSWPVVSGRKYWVKVMGIYQAAATTTGLQVQFSGVTVPTNSTPLIYRVRQAASGTDSFFDSGTTQTLTPNVSTATLAVATDAPFIVEGIIEPNSSGTLQFQFRSEVNASQVQIRPNCAGLLFDLTAS